MYKVRRLRAMGSLCRQTAAYNPAERRRFVAEAEYWEHLAEHELAVHFEECNAYRFSDEANVCTSANSNDSDARRLSRREYSHASGVAASIGLRARFQARTVREKGRCPGIPTFLCHSGDQQGARRQAGPVPCASWHRPPP